MANDVEPLPPVDNLSDLPEEILYAVFILLDFRALKSLACTSRLTNAIVIPILIDRFCPQIKSHNICELTSNAEFIVYPFRLAFAFPLIYCKAVSFNFVTSHSNLLKGIRGVEVILGRMRTGIEHARLSFAVSQWGWLRGRRKQTIDKRVWIREVFLVIQMLLERGCQTLEVDGFHDDLRLCGGENYFVDSWQGTITRHLTSSEEKFHRRRRTLIRQIFRGSGHNITQPRDKPTKSLKVMKLHHCDTLFQPFIFGQTISFLNASDSLQSLTLASRTLSREDWHLALSNLFLPQLSICEIHASRNEDADITKTLETSPDPSDILYFLGRHPFIKTFQLSRGVSEELGFHPVTSLVARLKSEKPEPQVLPNIEQLRGSVRFVYDLLQRNSELGLLASVFPNLHSLHIESGFSLKATSQSSVSNLRRCLSFIHDIQEAGGLQFLWTLEIDSQTYGSSAQFTVLDFLVQLEGQPEVSSFDDMAIPSIRSVKVATSEWSVKTPSQYSSEETRAIFRGVGIMFPMVADLHFGSMREWEALRETGVRGKVAELCPALKRICSDYERVIELDDYRLP